MKISNDRIWILITRVLSNEATVSEKEELRRWTKEKPEHERFFEEVRASWNQEPGDISFLFDRRSGINKLRSKIQQAESVAQATRLPKPMPNKPGKFSTLKVAASILLVVGILSAILTVRLWEQPVTTYSTSAMEQRIITLPDGSKVRLNRNSRIVYPENFAGPMREITLEGEAFFDVARNVQKPFVIHSGNAVIKVLGTAFSVKEQPQKGRVMVVVKEGVVSLSHRSNDSRTGVKLRKGYLGSLMLNNGNIQIEKVNTGNYFSWINGRLSFDNTSLSDVLIQLERIYGVNNSLSDSSLASLKLTAHTTRLSLEEVLKMISLSLEISYRKDGKNIIWIKQSTE